ncbi:MAG: hypothetical protein AB7O04_02400 [Hyphomonadaceae bacterium]
MIAPEARAALVAAANRAPSVHNIQPTRFAFEPNAIVLTQDPARRLHVGDPEGRDNLKSLGAIIEGLALALSERNIAVHATHQADGARLTLSEGASPDPLAPFAEPRSAHRGLFAKPNAAHREALARLAAACPDLHIIANETEIASLARFYDEVSLQVLRDAPYRAELLSWMRLSKNHPDYHRDGLNAEAMALSPFEAAGAQIVLGPRAFPALDALAAAGPLIAESAKVKSAAALALFHRPAAEHEIETGRRFYRIWLEIEREGLALCPQSVLADQPAAAARLMRDANLGADRKLVTVFRIGARPPGAKIPPRARLPATELIL